MSKETEALVDGETFESRHDRRLAGTPAVYKRNDEKLALELCLLSAEADPIEVFATYGYGREEALAVLQSPRFRALLAAARKDIDENGVGFRAKARVMAEALLPEAFEIATDPLASSAVRVDVCKWIAKMGGLEPKEKDAGGSGGGLTLNITFAGQAPQQVVTGEPLTIEHES